MQRLLLLTLLLLACSSSVCSDTYNIVDYGAVGDGTTLNTAAFAKAFAAASGGGPVRPSFENSDTTQDQNTVLVPPGNFLTAPFNMTSYTVLEVSGVILGVQDQDLYPEIAPLPSYGKSRDVGHTRRQALVSCFNCTHISVAGEGTIDGQGIYFWDLHRAKKLTIGRPRLVEFLWSDTIDVSGVTLMDSAFWTLHPIYCRDVYIHDMSIHAPLDSPNTDGIDPDSSANVFISNVTISVGDDWIAVKSGMNEAGLAYAWPCVNVTIEHCNFYNGVAISIGSETSGGIEAIWAHDCEVHEVLPVPAIRACYVKSSRGRGSYVRNIAYENIRVHLASTGVAVVDLNYDKHATGPVPTVENISFTNITGKSAKAGHFSCLEDAPCHRIQLTDVDIEAIVGWTCENAYGTAKNVKPKSCLMPE